MRAIKWMSLWENRITVEGGMISSLVNKPRPPDSRCQINYLCGSDRVLMTGEVRGHGRFQQYISTHFINLSPNIPAHSATQHLENNLHHLIAETFLWALCPLTHLFLHCISSHVSWWWPHHPSGVSSQEIKWHTVRTILWPWHRFSGVLITINEHPEQTEGYVPVENDQERNIWKPL